MRWMRILSLRFLYSDWNQLSYFNGSFSSVLFSWLFVLFPSPLVFSLVPHSLSTRLQALSKQCPSVFFPSVWSSRPISEPWNLPPLRYIRSVKDFSFSALYEKNIMSKITILVIIEHTYKKEIITHFYFNIIIYAYYILYIIFYLYIKRVFFL